MKTAVIPAISLALALPLAPAIAHDDHDHGVGHVTPGAVIARMTRGKEVVLTYDTRLMSKEGALDYALDDCEAVGKSLTKLTYKPAKSGRASAVFICK